MAPPVKSSTANCRGSRVACKRKETHVGDTPATTAQSGPPEFHACAGWAMSNGPPCRCNARCNSAIVWPFPARHEMKRPCLPFHAIAGPAHRRPPTENPMVARKFPRRSLRLWPRRARRGVDFQNKLQMQLNHVMPPRHTAAIIISRAADENELADADKRSVVPHETGRAKAAGATHRARASSGKVLAIRSAR